MTDIAKPFISFVVFAYNQNRFIRDAVEGAFSQQCAPVEIILSDDCSTDETFAIMQEMAKAYSGPHEVVVRRNEANLGLIDHINTVFQIARGEWVVVAAGDDISLPNRVAEIVRVISECPDINMVSSALIGMDEHGSWKDESCVFQGENEAEPAKVIITGLTELIENRVPHAHGATLAYSKKLIKAFPPMPSDAIYEDAIFRFRSGLLGKRAHLNTPLVCYRSHQAQTTNVAIDFQKSIEKKIRLTKGAYITCCVKYEDYVNTFCRHNMLFNSSIARSLLRDIRNRKLKHLMFSSPWPLRIMIFIWFQFVYFGSWREFSRRDIAHIVIPKINLGKV